MMDPLYLNKNGYAILETEKIVVGDGLQRLNVFRPFTKASTMEGFRKSVVAALSYLAKLLPLDLKSSSLESGQKLDIF